jgi:hypothetical protein
MFSKIIKTGVYLSFISSSLILFNCKTDHKDDSSELPGGVYKGGFLRVNEVENIKSLYPIAVNELLRFMKDL